MGIGSYGVVCKARCGDLVCAAKVLHPTLLDPEHLVSDDSLLVGFERECELLSTLQHPNIVQYLVHIEIGPYRSVQFY